MLDRQSQSLKMTLGVPCTDVVDLWMQQHRMPVEAGKLEHKRSTNCWSDYLIGSNVNSGVYNQNIPDQMPTQGQTNVI